MQKKTLFGIIIFIIFAGIVFAFLGRNLKKESPGQGRNQISQNQETSKPFFQIEKVYFSETNDPNNVLLNIKVKRNKIAEYKYEIHFPPQEGAPQGIGPIEVEFAKPEKFQEEVTTTPESLIQEFIARSYPDNVPEFGKSYFCKIKFYLTNGKEYTWEGDVGWEKVEEKKTQERGASPTAINNGVITLNFPPLPNLPSWEEELQREWVPDIVGRLIWGYRVKLNGDFVGDWPAVYTPTGANSYTISDPQSISLTNLVPGQYYDVEVYPLGIFVSPNLVTNDGRRYLIAKFGINNFSWAWSNGQGQPTSPWAPLQEIPSWYHDVSYPGYFFIYHSVFEGKVQAKRVGGGGGGGGGLIQ
jgi:hypothetical protein